MKLTLNKLEIVEIQILQLQLQNFISFKNASLDKSSDDYFDSILIIDIASDLYYNFRGKIEKTNKTMANLNLKHSEAVVLLLCCNNTKTLRNDYDNFVVQKTSTLIHQQLFNL